MNRTFLSFVMVIWLNSISLTSHAGDQWLWYTTENSGLPYDTLLSSAVDNDGSVWFGTYRSVSHFDGQTWTIYTEDHPFENSPEVQDIVIDSRGRKIFASFFEVYLLDDTTWTQLTLPQEWMADYGTPNHSVAIHPNGDIWFGCTSGLARYNGETWTTYGTAEDDGTGGIGGVLDMAIDQNGVVWAVRNMGILRYDGVSFASFDGDNIPGINNNYLGFQSVVVDKNNVKWFGNPGSIVSYNDTTWTIYPEVAGFNGYSVRSAAVDDDNNKWFGTANGVWIYNGESWTTFTADGELSGVYVLSISFGHDGSVWLATNKGVLKILSRNAVAVRETKSIPVFAYPPFPNPFNASTTIRYQTPEACHVELTIYDILGRKMATLHDGNIGAGFHEAVWSGVDDNGSPVGSGVYLYRLQAGNHLNQGKVLLMK